MSEAVILAGGQGEQWSMGPNRVRVLARRDGYAFVEGEFPAGVPGPPLHRHDWDEAFYVLDGKLAVTVGGGVSIAWPGDFVLVPGGVAHTFEAHGDGEARFLAHFSAARGLEYIEALAAAFPADGPPDSGLLAEARERFGVELVDG